MFSIITENLLGKIIDECFSVVLKKINDGIFNFSFYSNIKSSNIPQKDIIMIMKEAFINARKCNYLKYIKKEELKLLILDNGELIYSWIISDEPFNSDLIKLQNEKQEKKHLAFMQIIYNFIRNSRSSYLTFSTERVNSKLDVICSQNNYLSNQLDKIQTKLQWSLSSELNEIEEKINERCLKDALSKLAILEKIILNSQNENEIEKFYQLYSCLYLLNPETQQKSLPYLKKLIQYTKDSFLLWYRKTLYKLIDNKYSDVKDCLEQQNFDELEGEKRKLYSNVKINYLMLTKQFSELNYFLDSNKDVIEDYPEWSVKLCLTQGLYEDALNKCTLFNDIDKNKLPNKILILQSKLFFLLTKIQECGNTDDTWKELLHIQKEIDENLNIVNDDIFSLKTLLLFKGMILQNTNNVDEAHSIYKKIESLGEYFDPNFLRNYAIVLMLKKEYEKSLIFARKALDVIPNDKLSLEIYYSSLCMLNFERAERELFAFSETEETLDIKLKLIDVLVKQDKIKSAEEQIKFFDKKYPENIDVIYINAELENKKGNIDNAFQLYQTVVQKNNKKPLFLICVKKMLQIGLNKRNITYISYCISLIDKSITYEYFVIMGYEIIYSLILLGNILQAHQLINKMKEFDLINNDILRLDMNCYFHTKNYEQAIEIYKQLRKDGMILPEDQKLYLFALYHLGERDLLLDAIDIMPSPSNPNEFLIQSQIVRNVGFFDKALKLAHEGYLAYPNNQIIMENFIQMIFSRGSEPLDDKIINDFIICRDTYFAKPNQNQNIKSIQIPIDADGNDILKIIEKNLPEQKKIDYLNFINSHYFHISILANNFNYFFLWKNILELPQYKVFISSCSIDDLNNQYNDISENDVLIDLPSLITCAYLDILPYVAHFFSHIYISQDSIEILERAKDTQFNSFAENCTSGLYQLNDYSYPEKEIDYSDLLEYLNRIDTFRKNDNVHIVGIQLEPKLTLSEQLLQFIQKTNILEKSDILYACSSNIQIMLESYSYRTILKELAPNICCFEIEILLARLLNSRKMSVERYFEAIYKLLEGKYFCIYFDYNFIVYLFKKNNYSISKETTFIQKLLITDSYLKDWIASILINVIIDTIQTNPDKENIVLFVLEWVKEILKERNDFSVDERKSLFFTLYNTIPYENVKRLLYQIYEEK